jgi:hypothetical protein
VKHIGNEPPWQGRSFRYGSWTRGEELWDGSGYEWTWLPPPTGMISGLNEILKTHYLPHLREMLKSDLILTTPTTFTAV